MEFINKGSEANKCLKAYGDIHIFVVESHVVQWLKVLGSSTSALEKNSS